MCTFTVNTDSDLLYASIWDFFITPHIVKNFDENSFILMKNVDENPHGMSKVINPSVFYCLVCTQVAGPISLHCQLSNMVQVPGTLFSLRVTLDTHHSPVVRRYVQRGLTKLLPKPVGRSSLCFFYQGDIFQLS